MLRAGGQQINPGRLNGGMSQHVGQFGNILVGPVIGGCKEVAQIVGEHPGRRHACIFAKPLHFRPDLTARQTFSVSSEKDLTGDVFFFSGEF